MENAITTGDLEVLESVNLEGEKCREKCEWCEDDRDDGKANNSGAHDEAAMCISDTGVCALQVEHILYAFLDPVCITVDFLYSSHIMSDRFLRVLDSCPIWLVSFFVCR